jgi:tRNA G18 (ribose-2'-O)-methylase SpoU
MTDDPRPRQLAHAEHVPSGDRLPVRLLAHDLDDAANVGALFRLADAFALDHLYLTGRTPAPPDARIRRAARATEAHVAHSHEADALAVAARLRGHGWRLVALELATTSIDVRRLEVAQGDRVCLILGSESSGVCSELLEAADTVVHLPMRGHNSSMNVSMATAVAVHEIVSRLRPPEG